MTDLTPNDLSPQGEEAPGPEPLSPAAQAVLDAFSNASDGKYIEGVWVVNERTMLSAAIRALADQVTPSDAVEPRNNLPMAMECQRIRSEILAIATELKGQ